MRSSPSPPIVDAPYLLAVFGVSVHEVEGVRYLEGLWAQDLRLHAEYIPDLTVFCYVAHDMPENAVRVHDCPLLARVRFVLVDKPRTMLHGFRMLPRTVHAFWEASRGKEVVHSGVSGWPFPSSWLLLPVKVARGYLSVIVVESAFWREIPHHTFARRAWRAFSERMNAFCVRRADVPIFTTSVYRKTLYGDRPALVTPAAWVNEGDIASDEDIRKLVKDRAARGFVRLVFAGRLTEGKGVRWLIQALTSQQLPGTVHLDLFGNGPLEEWVRVSQLERPGLQIRLMGTLPYGEPFFRALRTYDALILPTITDEQPRILFDAYSQGLPVIASRTDGIVDYLTDGVHGLSFAIQDQRSLTEAIGKFELLRARWPDLARNCVEAARASTHRGMHCVRARAINAALDVRRGKSSATG